MNHCVLLESSRLLKYFLCPLLVLCRRSLNKVCSCFQIPMSCTPNQWRRRQKNQGGSSRPSSRNRRTFYSSSSVLYSSNSSGALSSSSSSSSPSNSADRFPRSPDKADSKLAQQQQRRRQNQISRSRLLPPRGRCPRVRW